VLESAALAAIELTVLFSDVVFVDFGSIYGELAEKFKRTMTAFTFTV
jgi:hypothetical protein